MADLPLPRLLLVDDEKDNLDAIRRLLRKDFEIQTALDGAEALKLLEKEAAFDVIVSDQRMPGMTGAEFLSHAEEHDALATRLLLTGFADLDAVIDAVNRGHIWRYLSKPWEPEDLRLTLKQAAERTQLRRSLDTSRRELERALLELRARDSSRERLLQILLHEFRTIPQILEGLRGLDPGGTDGEARLRFIESMESRLGLLSKDIEALLSDEKEITKLPRANCRLSEVLRAALPGQKIEVSIEGTEPTLYANADTLKSVFHHLYELLTDNSVKAPVTTSLELTKGPRPDLYVVFTLTDPKGPILPQALASENPDSALAWPLLLEPFVGAQDFKKHSTGLRVESARKVRALTAFGGKTEFRVGPGGREVELLVAFKLA